MITPRKAELLDYLRGAGQRWAEDASNAEAKYRRKPAKTTPSYELHVYIDIYLRA